MFLFEIIYMTQEQVTYSYRMYGSDAQDVADRFRRAQPFVSIRQINRVVEELDWH